MRLSACVLHPDIVGDCVAELHGGGLRKGGAAVGASADYRKLEMVSSDRVGPSREWLRRGQLAGVV